MAYQKKLKNSKKDTPRSLTSGQSDSDLQPEQSSGEQNSQQAAVPTMSRRGHFFKWLPSRSSGVKSRNNTTDKPTSLSASQSLAVSATALVQPHSSNPETPTTQVQALSKSSVVWTEVLKIATKKLGDNNLPLDLTTFTSQSAEENIEDVITALNILQEDDKKKRWHYTWRGKEVIVVEQLRKILKSVEKYSKVVDTAIQSNPQVSALVWAGVRAIMQVRA